MRNSFTYRPLNPKTSVEMYNTTDYFKYHQSSRPRTKLPRREMFVVNAKIEKGVLSIFNDYLKEIV